MHPETLVFLDVARRRVLMLRAFQPKAHFTSNYISQLTTLFATTTYLKEIVHRSGSAGSLAQQQSLSRAASLPQQQSLSLVLQCSYRGFLPGLSTLLIHREITARTKKAVLPADTARPHPHVRMAAVTASLEPGLLLQKKRLTKMEHGYEAALRVESDPSLLATRVVRQLQRVETRAIGEQSAAGFVTSPVPAAGRVFDTTQANPRKQQLQAAEEFLPAPRNPQPAPEINVAQLTEQVLNQLDRRLVAARERRGRI